MAGGEYVCFGAGTLGTAGWGMSLMGTLGDGALGGGGHGIGSGRSAEIM